MAKQKILKRGFDNRGGVIVASRAMRKSFVYESMPATAKVLMDLLHLQWRNDRAVGYDDQFHFGVTITHQGQSKRTTVMLEGYLVKALKRKHGLTDNATIRAWIEQAIKADDGHFDSSMPLTKQVKRMIIESFV